MPRIVLIADTHGKITDDVLKHLQDADELWHAGDIGNDHALEQLASFFVPVRAVWGNIDGASSKLLFPKDQLFILDGLKVFMTHIGGYPGHYQGSVLATIRQHRPDVFISGHSHILKVMRDPSNGLLHMNPGSCGYHGFHKFRTFLKFDINDGKINNLNAIDLGLRGLTKYRDNEAE